MRYLLMRRKMKRKILIVDDEKQMRRLLQFSLEDAGYQVVTAESGALGMNAALHERPDCMILDLGLPDMDGMTLLVRLREWTSLPVLIVSARGGEADIVHALDAGANDYLVKPFRNSELLARIRVALRSGSDEVGEPVLTFGAIQVDLAARSVRKQGALVKLTATEYTLLAVLARNEGRVLTHRFLMRTVWGPALEEETQYLRVYINQLRKKLEDDPSRPQLILTESGVGYRWWYHASDRREDLTSPAE